MIKVNIIAVIVLLVIPLAFFSCIQPIDGDNTKSFYISGSTMSYLDWNLWELYQSDEYTYIGTPLPINEPDIGSVYWDLVSSDTDWGLGTGYRYIIYFDPDGTLLTISEGDYGYTYCDYSVYSATNTSIIIDGYSYPYDLYTSPDELVIYYRYFYDDPVSSTNDSWDMIIDYHEPLSYIEVTAERQCN